MEAELDKLLAGKNVAEKLAALNELSNAITRKRKVEHETIVMIFDAFNALRDQWLAEGIPDVLVESAIGKFQNKWYVK